MSNESLLAFSVVANSAAGALFLLLAALFWRERHGILGRRFSAAVALGAAANAFNAELGPQPVGVLVQAPLLVLSWGGAAMFWLWAQAAFDDDFELRPWHAAPWVALAGGGLVAAYAAPLWPAAARVIGVGQPWLALGLVLLAAAQTLGTWRADLVTRRRRLRVAVVAGAVVYSATATLLGLPASPLRTAWNLRGALEAASLCALAVMVAWSLLRIDARDYLGVFAPAAADPPPAPASPAGSPAADPALLRRLDRLMMAERIYRQEGLTIGALAVKLGAPEYRLRQAINEGLGHRNFNVFVNGYRIGEAKAALADPGQKDVPVLTIAMDAGFQSIGPFNRAFKADAGMTPTEYRRTALSASAPPSLLSAKQNLEFGQSDREIG